MKIVLYNIAYSTGLKGSLKEYLFKCWRYLWTPDENLKKIIQYLSELNADVICLLEIDVGSVRNRFKSQVKTIADKLMVPFRYSALKYGPTSWSRFFPTIRKQHDAVLSKMTGTVNRHYLKSGTKKLVLEFRVTGISVFMVHLGLLRRNLRKKQLVELTKILKKCDRPYMLCGDFNIFKGLQEISDFTEKNKLKLIELGATFPSIKPKTKLDLIMACESIKIKAAGVSNVLLSDHRPVWVEIEH